MANSHPGSIPISDLKFEFAQVSNVKEWLFREAQAGPVGDKVSCL